MKRFAFALTALVAVVAAYSAVAQPPGGGRGPGGRGGPDGFRPPPHPLEEALDTNGDRQISAEEIENAITALKAIDKNEDGKLGEDELRPHFHGRPDGPGRDAGSRPRRDGRDRRGPGNDDADRRGPARDRRPSGGVEEMVERVLSFDKDDDGKLTKEELPDRMQGIIARGDTNKDGFVDKKELRKIAESFQGRGDRSRPSGDRPPRDRPEGGESRREPGGPPTPEMIAKHAMSFDADGDGKLDRDEVTKFAQVAARHRSGRGPDGGRGRRPQGDRPQGDRPGGRPPRD